MFRRPLLACLLLAVAGCAQGPSTPQAQTTVVFFTADSAALDNSAQAAISQAAAVAKQRPNSAVRIRGFAAPDAGSAAFNRALSRTRAEAVADALVAAGVPRFQLNMETRGAVSYELMPTESRRVEIIVG